MYFSWINLVLTTIWGLRHSPVIVSGWDDSEIQGEDTEIQGEDTEIQGEDPKIQGEDVQQIICVYSQSLIILNIHSKHSEGAIFSCKAAALYSLIWLTHWLTVL